MPDRTALQWDLGDGFHLLAAGVRRDGKGNLTADLRLDNGRPLFVDRTALNLHEAQQAWARAATGPDRPTFDQLIEGMLRLLDQAQALVQEEPREKMTIADDIVAVFLAKMESMRADGLDAIELFHDPDGEGWVRLKVDRHWETWPLASRGFCRLLGRWYYEARGRTPTTQARTDAISVLEGKALHEGLLRPVLTRLAKHEDTIYLDLADEEWQVVAIDADGWRVDPDPPVRFRRTTGMLALPVPEPGGDLTLLQPLINVGEDKAGEGVTVNWVLAVAWLIGALHPDGPFPLLITHGEQGSAKSTLHRMLRALIDPHKAPIRTLFRDERDLMISATNGWVLAYDNISTLQSWQSDSLCRVATGGGLSTRTLYENTEETIFEACRPILLNGIEEIATRSDLLDRSIIAYLPTIPEEERRPEKDLWRDFERVRPRVLGALLDAVSMALRAEAAVQLDRLPRMADFARWVVAAESALGWKDGTFLNAYTVNRDDANDLTLEASPVSQAMQSLLGSHRPMWTGTATDLLKHLNTIADDSTRALKGWPRDGRALSGKLRRLAPNLRKADIDLTFDLRDEQAHRIIRAEWSGKSASTVSSATTTGDAAWNDRQNTPAEDLTQMRTVDAHQRATSSPASSDSPWNGADFDAVDAVDADFRAAVAAEPEDKLDHDAPVWEEGDIE